MKNLPNDYEPHNRAPKSAGFTDKQAEDLDLVQRVEYLISSIELELKARFVKEIFHKSKKDRLDMAWTVCRFINNQTVREWIEVALDEWSDNEVDLVDLPLHYGSRYFSTLYQKIQEGEFDYE